MHAEFKTEDKMEVKVLDFQTEKSLSLVQLASDLVDTFAYISVAKAINGNLIEVKEVSDAGSVNHLFVVNHSDDYVFIMDGDMLEGAKQNRVVNTSIFLAPMSKTTIPVSCVEKNRWSHRTAKFSPSDFTMPSKARAEKARTVKSNLKQSNQYLSNQHEVWDSVDRYSNSLNFVSETSDLNEIIHSREKDFKEFLASFKFNEAANGMAMFSGHSLLSIDIFNRKDIYKEYFERLLKSAAVEMFALKSPNKAVTEAEASFKAVSFLDKIESIEKDRYDGVGVGYEMRFEDKELTGFELNFDKHLIQLAALNIGDNENEIR